MDRHETHDVNPRYNNDEVFKRRHWQRSHKTNRTARRERVGENYACFTQQSGQSATGFPIPLNFQLENI